MHPAKKTSKSCSASDVPSGSTGVRDCIFARSRSERIWKLNRRPRLYRQPPRTRMARGEGGTGHAGIDRVHGRAANK